MNKNLALVLILGLLLATATAFRRRTPSNDNNRNNQRPQQQQNNPTSDQSVEDAVAERQEKIQKLLQAPTALDRINILDKDTDFVFNFLNPPPGVGGVVGDAGQIIGANRKTFPAAIGNGLSMAIGYIGPCGMNTPHIHPRATEMNYAVNGSFATGFILENGARQVNTILSPGSVIVLPQGSIHWEANLECEPVTFVSVFNSEDAGVSSVAQNFFGIDKGILSATLGGIDIDTLDNIESIIPNNVAIGLKSCLQRCGFAPKDDDSNRSKSEVYSQNTGFEKPKDVSNTGSY